MGDIVSNFFISLDGVVESPDQWHFPYFNDELGEAIGSGAMGASAFLLGRVLYDQWSEYWPAQARLEPGEVDEFGSFINPIKKYVVSNTLTEATWTNTTLITGDVANQLREIKASTDGDIAMSGSATTVRWLLANGLLDRLELLLHPIVVGHGDRLFGEGATHPLELVRHKVLSTGVVWLTYVPAA
jgi:dihydrofolate reductase